MVEQPKSLIEIDLNQFKLYVRTEGKLDLSLHFNSPSRRFYLSVIALIVHEMKKLGNVVSIPIGAHYHTLALLNETIGDKAGSSKRENLLPRIYRKWKDALPDLEHAPLFTIPGRRKEYGDTIGKTYPFSDEEKDAWANLFEYKGSLENVRIRFSIDRLGATLDQVVLTYGQEPNISDDYSWDRFTESLEKKVQGQDFKAEALSAPAPSKWARSRWPTLGGVVGLLLLGVVVAIWYFSFHKLQPASDVSPFLESPLPLPDKPSIAVLPFVNMSGDPEQEYFCDGMSDDVITDLSKISSFLIISSNSTFAYKGKPVKPEEIAEELSVRYLLAGSVRKVGDEVRINVQLIDASTGHHLWADRYDGQLQDIFQLQDEITRKIVTSLAVKLTQTDRERLALEETDNIQAYDAVLKALDLMHRWSPDNLEKALSYLEKALELDPNYGRAYAMIGEIYGITGIPLKLNISYEERRLRGWEYIRIALKNPTSVGYREASLWLYRLERDFERALEAADRALALDPSDDKCYWNKAGILVYSGRVEEALDFIETALRIDPGCLF
jgi:TolB-like protein